MSFRFYDNGFDEIEIRVLDTLTILFSLVCDVNKSLLKMIRTIIER